jgi:hypothetical protein
MPADLTRLGGIDNRALGIVDLYPIDIGVAQQFLYRFIQRGFQADILARDFALLLNRIEKQNEMIVERILGRGRQHLIASLAGVLDDFDCLISEKQKYTARRQRHGEKTDQAVAKRQTIVSVRIHYCRCEI